MNENEEQEKAVAAAPKTFGRPVPPAAQVVPGQEAAPIRV